MNLLIYIPTSLNNPEFEILMSKAQNFLDQKKNVTILTCSGGKNYSCSINLYSNLSICYLCNKYKNNSFKKLTGDFKIIKTNKLYYKKYLFLNYKKLKSYKFEDIDIGLASYSSYVANTKDHLLQGNIAKEIVSRNVNTTIELYKFFKEILSQKKYDLIYIYNGRQNQYRPLFRLSIKKKIKVIILEYRGPNYKNVYEYINHLPTDYNYQSYRINKLYKNLKLSKNVKNKIVNYYYKSLRVGKKIQDRVSYIKNQKYNLLPQGYNKKENNVVIFNSSEDEYAALGEIYDKTLYKSQTEAIDKICESLKFKNLSKIKLWLRVHPNLKKVKWPYINDFYKLEKKYSFLKIISGKSKISSYALLFNCKKIITFGSNMGIEAVYYRIPAILLNRIPYENLNCQYVPKSHKQVIQFIEKNIKPRSVVGAEKYALFKMCGGRELKGFKGNYESGFFFHNKSIKKKLFDNVLYYVARLIDKLVYLNLRNIGIKRFLDY